MSRPPLLDTHAWVWWVDRDRRLGRPTIDALDALPVDAESDGVGLVRRRELDRGAQTARAAELSR